MKKSRVHKKEQARVGWRRMVWVVVVVMCLGSVRAEEEPQGGQEKVVETQEPGGENGAEKAPFPGIVKVKPGVFQIGKMVIEKDAGSVTVPTTINMNEGLIEFLLVTPQGSAHEAILVTDVQPRDLHIAMLLLGAKCGAPEPKKKPAAGVPEELDLGILKRLLGPAGDPVTLKVKWRTPEGDKTAFIEEWLKDGESEEPMELGPWSYTGSGFVGKTFLAQVEGNFAALQTNPSALINNPRPAADGSRFWHAKTEVIPAVGTAVELTITLKK